MPNEPPGYANLAISYIRVREYPEATAQIAKPLDLEPDDLNLSAPKREIFHRNGQRLWNWR